ncbi:hypothetical protein [Methylosinus sp. R-45379]|uniref:hypothetical protein n=1 Tax=Methylosinus sp. R-45379 TaxID=980563 RepID=UPI000AC6F69F|nr:hypothetical protein [Methylosinus sp. R-45379]
MVVLALVDLVVARLAWTKLLVDVAVEEVAAGGAMTLDEHLSQLDALVRAEAC